MTLIQSLDRKIVLKETAAPKDRHCYSVNECIARLYEQGADEQRIGQYVRRFKGWAGYELQSLFRNP
jgi:hypothetical protein